MKNFVPFCGTRRFMTAVTGARQFSLCYPSSY